MRLDTPALTKAVGATAAVAYSVCAFLVAVAPRPFTRAVGYVAHADLSGLTRSLTWGSFLVGLIAWTLACVGVVAATSALYNRWARS